jgi:hypothetical protein
VEGNKMKHLNQIQIEFAKEAVIKRCPKGKGGRYCLYDSKGKKLLGRHPSKAKALAQERAIQIHKHAELI